MPLSLVSLILYGDGKCYKLIKRPRQGEGVWGEFSSNFFATRYPVQNRCKCKTTHIRPRKNTLRGTLCAMCEVLRVSNGR